MKRPDTSENHQRAEAIGLDTVLRAAGATGNGLPRPLRGFDAYVSGFHCARDTPKRQRETHAFVKQLGPDFLQCVLFDGEGPSSLLVGVEYIVSEALFERLPVEERGDWHPHNYEVLSGQLVAPGLPPSAEKALLRLLLNSYGKGWHLWDLGAPPLAGERAMPLGGATLLWSFNKDGQLDANLERQRNRRLGVSLDEKRREREELVPLARPQEGVERLTNAFGELQRGYPGVVDAQTAKGGVAVGEASDSSDTAVG